MNNDERLRVLYIEDNCDSFEMLKVMLGMCEIDLDSARSGSEALASASSDDRFDLYLLDGGLPDSNGLSLCRTLRAIAPRTPVLFYSGNAHPEDMERGIEAGAAGYIIKPNSEKLAATIRQLVIHYRDASQPTFTDFRVLAAA
ncbi:MAG: response regulator [Acidobacteriota bacterium]